MLDASSRLAASTPCLTDRFSACISFTLFAIASTGKPRSKAAQCSGHFKALRIEWMAFATDCTLPTALQDFWHNAGTQPNAARVLGQNGWLVINASLAGWGHAAQLLIPGCHRKRQAVERHVQREPVALRVAGRVMVVALIGDGQANDAGVRMRCSFVHQRSAHIETFSE